MPIEQRAADFCDDPSPCSANLVSWRHNAGQAAIRHSDRHDTSLCAPSIWGLLSWQSLACAGFPTARASTETGPALPRRRAECPSADVRRPRRAGLLGHSLGGAQRRDLDACGNAIFSGLALGVAAREGGGGLQVNKPSNRNYASGIHMESWNSVRAITFIP
jgi:hypothetical protein